MHVRDLVEVAGIVASGGRRIVRAAQAMPGVSLERYWTASKCRLEDWNRVLKRYTQENDGWTDSDNLVQIRATLDEIVVSEMLTRVWTAVLVAHDRRHQANSDEPLARNIFNSHVEARSRALRLALSGDRFTTRQAVALNRVRRRTERWTDVLIGGLLAECDAREFAFDAERAADFATELAHRRDEAGGRQAWRLTLVSLRTSFQKGVCSIAANPNANGRVTASILGSFPVDLFDSTGLFGSLWMMRLAAATSDAQGMIDELLGPEPPHPAGTQTAARFPRR